MSPQTIIAITYCALYLDLPGVEDSACNLNRRQNFPTLWVAFRANNRSALRVRELSQGRGKTSAGHRHVYKVGP